MLAYANGFTLWHYTSPDLNTDIDTTGYFNLASDMLRVGDMMMANTSTGGTPINGIYVVASNSAGVVDVTNITQIGASDSD